MTLYTYTNTTDTAANFTSNDPVLLLGEAGFESDTNKLKFGDGVTTWTSLSYFGSGYTNLTEFVAQTAWRVFYSDGSGDVTELALGVNGTYLKSNGASSAPTFATPAGSGDVSKVGTPVNNQVGVWTGDGTLEGSSSLTYDGTTFAVTGAITLTEAMSVASGKKLNLEGSAGDTYFIYNSSTSKVELFVNGVKKADW